MQRSTAQKNISENQTSNSPLDELALLLKHDMDQVNDLIMEYMQSDVALIPQLAQYLIAAGGKRVRPLLTLATTAMFNGPMDKSYYLAAAVEFIHTATLLHDDVVDESAERRGQKAANLIFGNQASVLVGDFLFSKSFQMMVECNSLDILRILSGASAIIAQGEVLQLATTNDIKTSMPAYLDVIESKTAALFAASCETGAVISEQSPDVIQSMRDYGTKLGTAFQIIDDALDYHADQEKLGKELGDDFREGKMTAPIIFALENATNEELAFWQRTLGDKDQNQGDFETAMQIMAKHDAQNKTINFAKKYAKDAANCLNNIPSNQYRNLLSELTEYIITRSF